MNTEFDCTELIMYGLLFLRIVFAAQDRLMS